jgi:hypothetical protein
MELNVVNVTGQKYHFSAHGHPFIPAGLPSVVSPTLTTVILGERPDITASLADAVALVVITTSFLTVRGYNVGTKGYTLFSPWFLSLYRSFKKTDPTRLLPPMYEASFWQYRDIPGIISQIKDKVTYITFFEKGKCFFKLIFSRFDE